MNDESHSHPLDALLDPERARALAKRINTLVDSINKVVTAVDAAVVVAVEFLEAWADEADAEAQAEAQANGPVENEPVSDEVPTNKTQADKYDYVVANGHPDDVEYFKDRPHLRWNGEQYQVVQHFWQHTYLRHHGGPVLGARHPHNPTDTIPKPGRE